MTLRMNNPSREIPERPEVTYPCTWVYKVIGEDTALLRKIIVAACAPLEVSISRSHSSSKGRYHSLNAELTVPDEAYRLKIYETLKNHAAVKIVL